MIGRRRFLSIAAAALAAGATRIGVTRWQGRALGAEVSVTLDGPSDRAARVVARLPGLLAGIEAQFSLFDAGSALSRLNHLGSLRDPAPDFLALLRLADRMHAATGGLFDPTVQPLWQALATGGDIPRARAAIGWNRVEFGTDVVRLDGGQALTLNGIAQGFATDRVTALLAAEGFGRMLVDIGEVRATGGPWKLGLFDPEQGFLGLRSLSDGAIATSSPMAMPLAGTGHILHRDCPPLWSTVAVEAREAALADALSTAMVLMPRGDIAAMIGQHGIRRVTLVDPAGDLTTLG